MGLRSVKASREDVEALYRLLLDRSPESADEVDEWLVGPPTLQWVVGKFLSSREFRAKNAGVIAGARSVDTCRLRELIEALACRHPQRELYQPVYGIEVDHGGPVQRDCLSRCRLVESALEGLPVDKMSVLDVGCNMGYVTLHMSGVFARATGLEYDELLHEYCVELGAVLDSRATFRKVDFFAQFRSLAGSHDVCLMFSVIHYLVASQGIEAAKATLAEIVSCFDFTIIELSSRLDYSYMPEEAASMLEGLDNVEITLLGTSEKNARPIFLLKRKDIALAGRSLPIEQVLYCAPLESACSRIYFSGALAVKCFPAEFSDNAEKWRHERAAYEAFAGVPYVPVAREFGRTHDTLWICMDRKEGYFLNNLYQIGAGKVFVTARDKARVLGQLILALRSMLESGLYWNDLSAHNVVVSEHGVSLIDFAEAGAKENNDHLTMLSWLMHDLQLEKAASYESGVYEAIHAAGTDRARSRGLRFRAPQGFYAPELAWIDELLSARETLADLLGLDAATLARLASVADGPVGLDRAVTACDSILEIVGIVDWKAFPSAPDAAGVARVQAQEGREGDGEPALFAMTVRAAQSDDSALVQLGAMQQRAERSEVYCQSLLEELRRVEAVAARERSAWHESETEGARYLEAITSRAERAETHAAALADARRREAEAWAAERQAHAARELALEEALTAERERAVKAEELGTILRNDISRLMDLNSRDRLEAAGHRSRLEAEMKRQGKLLRDAQDYRALPWWKKLGR